MTELSTTPAYREFDLVNARRSASQLQSAVHQSAALDAVHKWAEAKAAPPRGGIGIVVLPTGGGKTFTAVRFLCRGPLSASQYRTLACPKRSQRTGV